MARINKLITIASGTPTRIWDGATAAPSYEQASPPPAVWVTNFFVQMMHGGSGLGFVMTGIPYGTTPNYNTAGTVTGELAPASASAPGGSFSQDQSAFGSELAGTVDITRAWVDGASSGDKVIVSYDTVN